MAAGGATGQAPPAVFLCPIGKSLMVDPVLASDGVNYERAAIEVTKRFVATPRFFFCAAVWRTAVPCCV